MVSRWYPQVHKIHPNSLITKFASIRRTRRNRLDPERKSAHGRIELPALNFTTGTATQETQLRRLNRGLRPEERQSYVDAEM